MHAKTASLTTLFFILICLSCGEKPLPPEAILPVPSEAQMRWHEMEMNAFIHFTTNTFTDIPNTDAFTQFHISGSSVP